MAPPEMSHVSAPMAFFSSRLTSAFPSGSCSTCSWLYPASPEAANGFSCSILRNPRLEEETRQRDRHPKYYSKLDTVNVSLEPGSDPRH